MLETANRCCQTAHPYVTAQPGKSCKEFVKCFSRHRAQAARDLMMDSVHWLLPSLQPSPIRWEREACRMSDPVSDFVRIPFQVLHFPGSTPRNNVRIQKRNTFKPECKNSSENEKRFSLSHRMGEGRGEGSFIAPRHFHSARQTFSPPSSVRLPALCAAFSETPEKP